MNKQCYRVVFNKARGMMMVVSEVTKSQNKKPGNRGGKKSSSANSESPSGINVSYHRLAMAILCCQSMIYTQVQAANSQIQNTASNIPVNQRAALLKAANGTPIVNIRTPNSNGLSHNTYNQFDIGSNGAILNNSIGSTNSHLAGVIAGNQYLAQSAANTILNEVRSSAPTKFQGNIEIAGQRADVIIASPSGLQIQGGGFINANRATLTTGTPKIDSAGNLTGFDVKQGQIQFDNDTTGNALGGALYDGKNKNQANYVDILARAVAINGKIHANQEVDIITGSNIVDYDTGADTKITGTGTATTLAVDVSTLGGIYANSINLVGTENGLGFRNAGNIKAAQQIVLTNSGKIENTGAIQTTKAQTSLLSINATGTTGNIEHSGTIGSYGMVDMQADKDVLLNKGIIRKENPGTAVQLMPDVLRINAKGDIKLNDKSDVRNFTIDDKANIFINADQSTLVTEGSIVGSNGGVEIDSKIISSISSDAQIFSRYAPIKINSNNLTFINGGNLSSKGDIYIGEKKIGDQVGFHSTAISGNSQIKADGDLTVTSDNLTNIIDGSVINAKNIVVNSKSTTRLENTGAININGDALIRSDGKVEIKNIKRDGKQDFNINKKLDIHANDIEITDSSLLANKGITAQSSTGNIDISGSGLLSTDAYVAAIAEKGNVNISKSVANSENLIVSAANKADIVNNWLLSKQAIIASGNDTKIENTIISGVGSNDFDNLTINSKGKSHITGSTLRSGGNVRIDSKGRLSIIDTNVNATKNLVLNSDDRIYSNATSSVDKNGKESYNYNVGSKKNSFIAGDILALNSYSSQYLSNTDFTGSAISLDGWGHALAPYLNFTATGASKSVEGKQNGDIQIINKDNIYLNYTHSINANKDFIAQAHKGIHINGTPKIIAQSIGLKTVTAKTNKSDKLIDNTFGDGDINISNTELTTNGKADSGRLIIEAANHLNIIDSKTNSTDNTTLKSGNLMRLNNSQISSGKHLTIDSNNQLITNGERYAKNSGTVDAPKWSNSWRHVAGDTTLNGNEIVSIDSRSSQAYQNTNITGGAVIINSGSGLGLNNKVNINATGNATLAKNLTKLSDGKAASTLNGDLIITSAAGNLTIDPNKVTLAAAGDATLAARGGQLYLKGYAGTQGFGSEKVVKLTAGGDISLSGKEVLIEGSDLISKKGFSGSNVVLVDGKLVPTAGISITATDGSVELKAVKNSFSNYVSPYKIKTIEQQITAVNSKLREYDADIKILEQENDIFKEIGKALDKRDLSKAERYAFMHDKLVRLPEYKQAKQNKIVIEQFEAQLEDLTGILETSKKASTGFEHKAVSLTAGKDINIIAKQGVLIEGGDITSSTGGINIAAEGNHSFTEIKDENDNAVGLDYNSIVITGLAEIYQQGDINSKGEVTGDNYSYHQLINQPKLNAKGDIRISAIGNGPLNTGIKDLTNNNTIVINSADIVSTNGDVYIDAARGDINLEASQVAFMDGSQEKSTSRKWYGKKKTKITTKTSENSNAVTTDISANNIYLNAESDISVYGSLLQAAPKGDIKATAGREIGFLEIEDRNYSEKDIKKKSSWLGVRYNKDHTNDTRQEIKQLPATLVGGKVYTKSGGNTTLKGTVFNTANKDDIQVGFGPYAEADAKLILGAITNTIKTTHTQDRESTVWMKIVDKGSVVTTGALPKFNQTPTMIDAKGRPVEVDIDVPVSVNNATKSSIQTGTGELGKIALNLSKQPGYEYLAALDKTNDINWVQVDLIQKNWNYTQEGLTPGAAALIAIAVTMATGGVGGAAGMGATLTGTTGAMGAASTAAFSSLAAQASVTLINNKGDINKTLNQLASSATVRSMATAALTAGVAQNLNIPNMTNNEFANKLVQGVGDGVTSAFVNAAVNGVSLEDALRSSLRSTLVDVFAASTFTNMVKPIDTDDFARNLAHKLVAAGVGCVTASAKKQNCDAGALGAAVGEMIGDYMVKPSQQFILDDGTIISYMNPQQQKEILTIGQLMVGTISMVSGLDVNAASDSAKIAIINNANVYKVGNDPKKIAAIAGRGLGQGYYARVDKFQSGNTNDFEVHVYKKNGSNLVEVGIYDSKGSILNKHQITNAPILPKEVANQLKGQIVDTHRVWTGLVSSKGGQDLKGKYNIQAPKVFIGLGMIQSALESFKEQDFYNNPSISSYEKLLKLSGQPVDDPKFRDIVGLPPKHMM